MEGYKQKSAVETTLKLVSDLVELEEVVEDEDDQQERETPIKDSQEGIKMKEEQEKEKENQNHVHYRTYSDCHCINNYY